MGTFDQEKPTDRELLETLVSGFDRLEINQQNVSDDLKRVERDLRAEISGIHGEVSDLRGEMRAGFHRVNDRLDRIETQSGEILSGHEERITALETRPAKTAF